MDLQTVIALVSALGAIVAAGIAYASQAHSARYQRAESERQLLRRYREPLVHAAYNLQGRLYRLANGEEVGRLFSAEDAYQRDYYIDNSLYLVAQYLAWTEIVRNEVQFIELGRASVTRRLAEVQDRIYDIWQNPRYGTGFRLFAGEQRAIGEAMTLPREEGGSGCLGYGAFLDRQKELRFLAGLRADLEDIVTRQAQLRPRLVALQQALIDLLACLDPGYQRFPKSGRSKLAA